MMTLMTNKKPMVCMQVTSQSHSSVVGQTVGVVTAHHGHAVPAPAAVHAVPAAAAHHGHAHAVPAVAHHAHAGHAGHALGKREADADADAQLVGFDKNIYEEFFQTSLTT